MYAQDMALARMTFTSAENAGKDRKRPQTGDPMGSSIEAVSLTHCSVVLSTRSLRFLMEAQTETLSWSSSLPWSPIGWLEPVPIDRAATFWNSLSALRRLRSMVPAPDIVPNPNGTHIFRVEPEYWGGSH